MFHFCVGELMCVVPAMLLIASLHFLSVTPHGGMPPCMSNDSSLKINLIFERDSISHCFEVSHFAAALPETLCAALSWKLLITHLPTEHHTLHHTTPTASPGHRGRSFTVFTLFSQVLQEVQFEFSFNWKLCLSGNFALYPGIGRDSRTCGNYTGTRLNSLSIGRTLNLYDVCDYGYCIKPIMLDQFTSNQCAAIQVGKSIAYLCVPASGLL